MSNSGNQGGRAERPAPKTAEDTALANRSLVGSIFAGLWDFVCTLFFSMVLSVVVAIVGVTFFWPEEGANHERKTLAIEMNALAHELSEIGQGLTNLVASMITTSANAWWGGRMIADFVEWCAQFVSPKAAMYGEVVFLSIQVFMVRLGVIFSSIPIIVLWVVMGIVCGLTERDLRRFNAALESSTTFNLAFRNVKIPFICFIALYLSWPTQAYALVATIPVCLGSFVMFYLAVAHYKKRL